MANAIWVGRAGGTPHTYTITIAGTWANTETASATINQSTVTITVQNGETTTNEVAAALSAAINADAVTGGEAGTELRNVGGQQYAEWTEVTATVASSVVTVRQNVLGRPFTLTSSDTAAAGTATAALTVDCTGPMFADNAANWAAGTLPVDGDTLVFNQGNVNCSYGLTYFRDNTLKVSFLRTTDYTGTIGLPLLNASGFMEYRQRWLELYDSLDAKTIHFEKGHGSGAGGATYLDLQGQTYAELFARDTGTGGILYAHGGTVSSAYFGAGRQVTDPDDSNETSGMTIDAMEIYGGTTTFGRLTAWATAGTTATCRGGTVIFDCAFDQGTPELTYTQVNGDTELRADGDITDTVTIQAGAFKWTADGDAAGTINVWGDGTLDLRGDGRTKAFSGTINAYDGATVHKGGHTVTLTPLGCTLEDLTITS